MSVRSNLTWKSRTGRSRCARTTAGRIRRCQDVKRVWTLMTACDPFLIDHIVNGHTATSFCLVRSSVTINSQTDLRPPSYPQHAVSNLPPATSPHRRSRRVRRTSRCGAKSGGGQLPERHSQLCPRPGQGCHQSRSMSRHSTILMDDD